MRALAPRPTVYNPDDGAWQDNVDEITFWPRITWMDCGSNTGLATIWFHPVRLLDMELATSRSILAWYVNHTRGPENEQAVELLRYVKGIVGTEGCAVGLEKFTVRTVKSGDEFLSSPRVAAKVDLGLYMGLRNEQGDLRRIAALWQDPTDVVNERRDAQLQQLGMWVPGRDDRRDALKHCLLHLQRIRVAGMGSFEKIYGWTPEWEETE